MRRIREARKRDNRIVPFDESKVADAIYAAFRSVGEGDRSTAEELAAAVTHFLEEKFTGSIPGIEDIQDVVETVLIETGHTRVAKAYILYRQKRSMLRETLQVRRVPEAQSAGVGGEYGEWGEGAGELPEVERSAEGSSRWQKSKIVAALIREADLDPGLAEEVASTVERKVLNSGLRRLSTTLIRELVDNELFERGFSAKLQKQAPISLPKYNLEQIIFGTDAKEGFTFPKNPLEVRNIVADRILYQYSLQEVFTPEVAEAHAEGRLFLHRLSDPIRLARLFWSLPAPTGSRTAALQHPGGQGAEAGLVSDRGSYADPGDLLRKLWHLAHFFSEEIRLSGLTNLTAGLPGTAPARRADVVRETVSAFLDQLSQMDSRPDIAMEFDLVPGILPWLESLHDFRRVRPRRFLLAFRLQGGIFRGAEGERALRILADLYAQGERIEFLPPRLAPVDVGDVHGDPSRAQPGDSARPQPADASRAGAESASPSGILALAAKITLNLPRAAFRSGRDRRASIETEIDGIVDLAVKGHLERRRFIERLGSNRENPLWDLIGKGSEGPQLMPRDLQFGVGLLGLNECIKYLTGSELHQDATASKLAVEIVREIQRKLRREERSLGIRLVLEETMNVGPLRVLERADRRAHSQMAEIDRGRNPAWGPAYTHGVRLHRMAPVDPFRRVEDLARYLRFVEPAGGFVEDFPELRSSAHDLLLSLLEECVPVVSGGGPAVVVAERDRFPPHAGARKGREEKG